MGKEEPLRGAGANLRKSSSSVKKFHQEQFVPNVKHTPNNNINPVIGFLDVDAFECQLWQRENPRTRGKPCIVANQSGRICAVSYEAKAVGINRKDTPTESEARKKCPKVHVFWKPDRFGKQDQQKCRQGTYEVITAIQDFLKEMCAGDDVKTEVAASDEMYLDLSAEVTRGLENLRKKKKPLLISDAVVWERPRQKKYGPFCYQTFRPKALTNGHAPSSAMTKSVVENWQRHTHRSEERLIYGGLIMQRLCAFVEKKTKLVCSGGVASNKLLAKLGCGVNKPKKVTVFPEWAIVRVSKSIKISSIPGLGGLLGEKLQSEFEVETMYDLRVIDYDDLEDAIGKEDAQRVSSLAQGKDVAPVVNRITRDHIRRNKPNFELKTLPSVGHALKNLTLEAAELLLEEKKRYVRTTSEIRVEYAFTTMQKPEKITVEADTTTPSVDTTTSVDDNNNETEKEVEPTPKEENQEEEDEKQEQKSEEAEDKEEEEEEMETSGSSLFEILTDDVKLWTSKLPGEILEAIKEVPTFKPEAFKLTKLAFVLSNFSSLNGDQVDSCSKSPRLSVSEPQTLNISSSDDKSDNDNGVDNLSAGEVENLETTQHSVIPTTPSDYLRLQSKMVEGAEPYRFQHQVLGSFRMDKDMKYSEENLALPKLVSDKQLQSLVGCKLLKNYCEAEVMKTSKLIPDYSVYDRQKHRCFSKWLKEKGRNIPEILEGGGGGKDGPSVLFIAFQARIYDILKTLCNRIHGEWKIFAVRTGNVIHLWDEKTPEPMEDSNRTPQFMGALFENMVTGRKRKGVAINEVEKIFEVQKVTFGKHNLLLLTHVDAEDSVTGDFVQVSATTEDRFLKRQSMSFKDHRSAKRWAQAEVSGAKKVVVGGKQHNGVITTVDVTPLEEIRQQLGEGKADECFNFQHRMLQWIKDHLPESDPNLVKKFAWIPGQIKVVCSTVPEKEVKKFTVPKLYFN